MKKIINSVTEVMQHYISHVTHKWVNVWLNSGLKLGVFSPEFPLVCKTWKHVLVGLDVWEPPGMALQWRKCDKVLSRESSWGRKHDQVLFRDGRNMIKCPLGCPITGENVMKCHQGATFPGKETYQVLCQVALSGENLIVISWVPSSGKNKIRCPLRSLSNRENMVSVV